LITGGVINLSNVGLIREPKLQPILSHLHTALASRASNDAISEDLFDMIGYDDMDMIVEILDNRSFIAAEVNST
jgi:antiviral helicase SLH1